MRDYRDAKAMAQTLRQVLKERSVSLTNSESLELIAKVLGFADWNVLSARVQAEPAAVRPVAQDNAIKLPVVPMRGFVLFPRMTSPVIASRMKTVRAIARAMAADRQIFFVTQRRFADGDPKPADLYDVGVVASVIQQLVLEDGTNKIMVQCLRRARIVRFEADDACLVAELSPIQEEGAEEEEATTLSREVLQCFERYANVTLSSPPQALNYLPNLQAPSRIADAIAQYLSVSVEQRQELLHTASIVRRLKSILAMMNVEQQAA